MSTQVRLDAVIVAAGRFLTSPDIGFRSPVTGRPARLERTVPKGLFQYRSAATCAAPRKERTGMANWSRTSAG